MSKKEFVQSSIKRSLTQMHRHQHLQSPLVQAEALGLGAQGQPQPVPELHGPRVNPFIRIEPEILAMRDAEQERR